MNIVLYILLALFWGCSYIAIRYALDVYPPFFSAFARTFLTALFLSVYLCFSSKPSHLKDPRVVLKWAWVGIFAFAIPWAALFWGEQYVQPAVAGMINSSVPIFALVLAWFLIPHERASMVNIVGVLIGFVGIVFIFSPTFSVDMLSDQSFYGMLAIVVMSISYAINLVLTRKYGRQISLVWAVWIQAWTSSAILLLISVLSGETVPSWSVMFEHPKAMLSILYLAIFSTTLAMLIFYHLVHSWGTVKSSSVNYLLPFVAIAVDFIALSLVPSWQQWVGVTLIVLGLLLLHDRKRIKVKV